jgi:integrase/recombinase XerD
LSAITLADLQGFAQSLVAAGLAPVSRARTIAAIKSLFGFCTRMRMISFNLAAELPLPCSANRLSERFLPEDDVQRILGVKLDPRDKTLLNLIYIAGLRVSEATQLRWRNLRARGDAGLVTVFGKGGRTRSIPLPPAMWSELTDLRQDATGDEPLFPSRTGRLLDRGRVRAIVRQAARRAGVDGNVSPHWLRHAHASHALDHGAPIHLVQATLGHRTVTTTSAYLHARPGDSSARFLERVGMPPQFSKLRLPLGRTGVMDVVVASGRQRRVTMKTQITEEQGASAAGGTAHEPKTATKATAAPQKPRVAPAPARSAKKATGTKKARKGATGAKVSVADAGSRPGSKTAKVLELLKRPGGATAKELMKATGWLPHSVRSFLSGTVGKKMGLAVSSAKPDGGERSYSVKA